jgi:DNA-binding transcriptional regulator YdaS (Cro superfamily)
MSNLTRALRSAEIKPAELARIMKVRPQHVHNWCVRGVPAERCVPIEEATARRITREQLRPDLFGPVPDQSVAA